MAATGTLFAGMPWEHLYGGEVTNFPAMKKNLVLISCDFGFYAPYFNPKNASLDSRYLKFFGQQRKKMTVFQGIEAAEMGGGHRSHHSIFTAQNVNGKINPPFVSLDQLLASRTTQSRRLKSLVFSTGQSRMISWSPTGTNVFPITTADKLNKELFINKPDKKKLLAEKQLLLKYAKNIVKPGNKKAYIQALDIKLESLDAQIKWSDVALPRVDFKFTKPALDLCVVDNHGRYPTDHQLGNLKSYLDLIELSLQHKQSQIYSFNIGHAGVVPIPGVTEGYHSLTHGRGDSQQLIKLEEFQLRLLADFVRNLDEKGLLDDTLVLIAGAFGNSRSHSTRDLPMALVGGGLHHTGLIKCKRSDGMQTHHLSNLYVSLMHFCGLEDINSFAGHTGNLDKYFM